MAHIGTTISDLGFRRIREIMTPIIEIQREKETEHEIETGLTSAISRDNYHILALDSLHA